jgi:hypothetical protein
LGPEWQKTQVALASAPVPPSWHRQQFVWTTTFTLRVSSAQSVGQ